MTSTVKIHEADFRPLSEFPLKWRWTDSRWNKLPNSDLKSIRPFTDEKALELLQYSQKFSDHTGLLDSHFDNVASIDTSTYSPKISKWLLDHFPNGDEMVIVSWDHRHAAMVLWRVFCNYWDDFCYPASDDVAIWPISEEWALMYLHTEQFVFGVRRVK